MLLSFSFYFFFLTKDNLQILDKTKQICVKKERKKEEREYYGGAGGK